LKSLFKSPISLFYAIMVHAILIGVMVFSFDWTGDESKQPKVKIVQAVAVDESKVKKQVEKLKKIEDRKRRKEEARQRKLQKQADDAKKAREREEKRLAEAKKNRESETQKVKNQEKKRKLEEKRLADTQKKRQELELKAKREEAKLKKARNEQERIAAETKKREEKERKKREAERLMLEQMLLEEESVDAKQKQATEQMALAKAQEGKNATIIDKYKSLIRNKIESKWNIPLQFRNSNTDYKCEVYVQLIPGGIVKHAETVSGKCDPGLKVSIESAVFKASPLPMPADPALFGHFREISLIVKPPESQ